jgi:tRNA(Ile)-lysidine synthase
MIRVRTRISPGARFVAPCKLATGPRANRRAIQHPIVTEIESKATTFPQRASAAAPKRFPMSVAPVFEERLAASFPPDRWLEAGVLVAFSAGPDSTALLAALAALCPRDAGRGIVAAHFNHRLRAAESDADEAHAVEIAGRLSVECIVERGDAATTAAERGDGVEEAARTVRYRFLEVTAKRLGLRLIATGHTLDDQVETVLHRIVRGTGVTGLAGIPRSRPLAEGTIGLVRPLLEFRRSEVLDYLRERGLPYRVDASNADVRFTRNRIRHELLPLLARDYNPEIAAALLRLSTQADELRELVGALVAPLFEKGVVRADTAGCELDCPALAAAPRHLVRELLVTVWQRCGWPLQAMGYDQWESLAALIADPAPAKRMFPGQITADRRGDRLVLNSGNEPRTDRSCEAAKVVSPGREPRDSEVDR